jgi:hypothetical protein
MGYPMTWQRIVDRNGLKGDYMDTSIDKGDFGSRMIAGDMRRLERDTRDDLHIKAYAKLAGCTKAQAKKLLDAFFDKPYIPL